MKKKKNNKGNRGNGPEPAVAASGLENAPAAGVAQGDNREWTPAGGSVLARTRGGLARSRGGDPGASSSKPKKAQYINFHYHQDHLLCDDFYSSAGFLRQLTIESHELPKVPELTESDWYRCMASAITGVSHFAFTTFLLGWRTEILGDFFL